MWCCDYALELHKNDELMGPDAISVLVAEWFWRFDFADFLTFLTTLLEKKMFGLRATEY